MRNIKVNDERTKVESRPNSYSIEEKEYILTKTHRKCAKCGCKLSIKDDFFTVDHYIPLNKGGSNNIKNLVPMCRTCNKEKDDYTVTPSYYRYLSDDYTKEIAELYMDYCESVEWKNLNNYCKFELMHFPVYIPIESLNSHLRKTPKEYKGYKCTTKIRSELYLRKTKPEECDRLVDYVYNYNAKHGWIDDKAEIKELIQNVYDQGCMYVLSRSANVNSEIIAVLPIAIEKSKVDEFRYYHIRLYGLPVNHPRMEYLEVLETVFIYLFGSIAQDKVDIVVQTQVPRDDPFLITLYKEKFTATIDDSYVDYAVSLYLSFTDDPEEVKKEEQTKHKDLSEKERYINHFKKLRKSSEWLEKTFSLPPIKYVFPDVDKLIAEKEANE